VSGSAGVGSRFVMPLQQLVDPQGIPYVGAQAFFFATGTSTTQLTYADVALTIPNPQPVLTNAAGFFPNIFMVPAPAYRVRVEDPTGAVIFDCDPVGAASGLVPGSVPIGSIMPFGGTTPPSGWLFCDGSAVSRSVFAPLFAVLGTTFGAGDGATTFNLPDLRGRVVGGQDNMGGVAANRLTSGGSGVPGSTLGGVGGSELLASHNHAVTDPTHTHTDSGHAHAMVPGAVGYPALGGTLSGGGNLAISFPSSLVQTDFAHIEAASTGITINNAGTGSSANVQPTLVALYIIFVG
jgi:microcystin-dependent protein